MPQKPTRCFWWTKKTCTGSLRWQQIPQEYRKLRTSQWLRILPTNLPKAEFLLTQTAQVLRRSAQRIARVQRSHRNRRPPPLVGEPREHVDQRPKSHLALPVRHEVAIQEQPHRNSASPNPIRR